MDKLVKRFVALSISSRLTQGEEQADAGRESNGTGESLEHQRIPARGQSTHDRVRRELAHLGTGNASVNALQAM